jgi:putative ABC transport system ATP-binding protein
MYRLEKVDYKNILKIDSLHIRGREITFVEGESGSGKTTLLRLLNKMITPDRGSIFFKNTPISTINSVSLRRRVVMLSQEPAIFPGNIRENLLIGLKFSERPPVSEGELSAMMTLLHLEKSLDDPVVKLSGGERQRIALGRVLLMDPEVLLLDEPSSALDEDTERLMIEALVSFTKDRGKTLVMVTHSKKIIEDFPTRIIRLKKNTVFDDKEVDQPC